VLWNGPVLELDDARSSPRPRHPREPPDLGAMIANLRRNPRRAIGDALLDQRLVAGIGNVWKAESLWKVRVSPWLPVAEVSDEELRAVLEAAHELMTASVETGRGRRVVYNRAGRGCRRCGTRLRRADRATTTASPTGARSVRRGGTKNRVGYMWPCVLRTSTARAPLRARGLCLAHAGRRGRRRAASSPSRGTTAASGLSTSTGAGRQLRRSAGRPPRGAP
jgi:hypothetical protein